MFGLDLVAKGIEEILIALVGFRTIAIDPRVDWWNIYLSENAKRLYMDRFNPKPAFVDRCRFTLARS